MTASRANKEVTDTTEDECARDLVALTTGRNEHWIDAISYKCFKEVRDASTASEVSLDFTMMYHIQRIVTRLSSKSSTIDR